MTYHPGDDSGERTLRLVYWYPTEDTEGDAPLYHGLLATEGALEGAALAAADGARPLVVFSHGNGSFAEQSYFLTEFLASHGFVVAAMDHTGNTLLDLQDDLPPEIFHWRPWDVTAVLDHIYALPQGHFLAGGVSDRVGVTGHSFGGYTSMAIGGATWAVDLAQRICRTRDLPLNICTVLSDSEAHYRAGFRDDRVDAIAPMSPGGVMLFTGGVGHIAVPTLLLTGARDDTTPNTTDGDPAWSALSAGGGHVRVDFATAGHFTFSHACELAGLGVDDGCGEGFIAAEEAHRAINAYILAFFYRHVLGDDAGADLLDGTTVVSDDVTLSVGQQ
ncbi:MAG: hypothetical protein CSA66_06030 [Proteobacteria bacterium]|nr:MAG: hypothetical protein CSA66_06030 [Pseudomonadota bacterium]